MPQKPENVYIGRIRRKLKKLRPDIDAIKMNNPYTAGIADLYIDGPGGDIWVEAKWSDKIPRILDLTNLAKKPCLSKLQQDFLWRRYNNGRAIAVLLGTRTGGYIFPDTSWNFTYNTQDIEPLMDDQVLEFIIDKTG